MPASILALLHLNAAFSPKKEIERERNINAVVRGRLTKLQIWILKIYKGRSESANQRDHILLFNYHIFSISE